MTPESAPFNSVAIVGLGLIGGSIALGVRRVWPTVRISGIDRPEVVEVAHGQGAVDDGGQDLDAAEAADLVVLAAPVVQNIQILRGLPDRLTSAAVITDTSSTKTAVLEAGARLPPFLTFVGGHPIAGSAASGFAAASPALFVGNPWLFAMPASERALSRLESFAAGLGAVPTRIPAEAHDPLFAYVSHLPQFVASALMHVVASRVGADGLRLAGAGLRDTTRLASSPAAVWRDIAATNATAIRAALQEMRRILETLDRDLLEGAELDRIFDSAGRSRRDLEAPATPATPPKL